MRAESGIQAILSFLLLTVNLVGIAVATLLVSVTPVPNVFTDVAQLATVRCRPGHQLSQRCVSRHLVDSRSNGQATPLGHRQ